MNQLPHSARPAAGACPDVTAHHGAGAIAARLRSQYPFAIVTARPGGRVIVTDNGRVVASGEGFTDMLRSWERSTQCDAGASA